MTRFAWSERQALADLILDLGPDAPTLCEGWNARDLAAHLVARERRPDAAAGLLVPPLRGYSERVRTREAAREYAELVRQVRKPPWWSPLSNTLADEAANSLEFFIHHEDVRRAQPDWRPRELPPQQQSALWRRVRGLARLSLRHVRATVRVKALDYGELTAGAGGPRVRMIGVPGELALFLSGRQRVARVQIDGPPVLVSQLRDTPLPL